MTSFASLTDVQALCLSPLSAEQEKRAKILLDRTANRIRAYTGQTFDLEQTTETLRALGSFVVLPHLPVVTVDAVKIVDYLGQSFPIPVFGFDQIDRIDLSTYGSVLNLPEAINLDNLWSGTVEITYTHGYEPIPDEIVDLNADLVARVFNSPTGEQTGIRSQSVGPYSVGLDSATTTSAFTYDDCVMLDRYKPFGATVELH